MGCWNSRPKVNLYRLPLNCGRTAPETAAAAWAVSMKSVAIYEYFFSISAKNALESRTKSASVSLISSPAWSFSSDFSGGSLSPETAEFGYPWSLLTCSLPLLSSIELHRIRTSFSGLPSRPSMPESRCTNM